MTRKKTLLLVLIMVTFHFYGNVLDSVPSIFLKKNELRLDVTKLVSNGRLGLTYERNLNERISVGLNTVVLKSRFYDLEYDWNNYENHLQVNPFARVLFHKRPKKEFFAEVLVSYTMGEMRELKRVVESPYAFYEYQENRVSGWGTGAAIGGKYLLFEDFCIEFSLGGGSAKIGENKATFINRSSISLGYRF